MKVTIDLGKCETIENPTKAGMDLFLGAVDRAVDKLEGQGGVQEMDKRLLTDMRKMLVSVQEELLV